MMTDIKQILKLIDQINQDCKKVLAARVTTSDRIKAENEQVDAEAKSLVKGMKASQAKYEAKHFEIIRAKVQMLVDLLMEDYSDEYTNAVSNPKEFSGMTFEQAQAALNGIFEKINVSIAELNSVDFDSLVPPFKVVADQESFYTCSMSGEKIKDYDCDSRVTKSRNSKPIKGIVEPLFVQCKRAFNCVDYITTLFRKTVYDPAGNYENGSFVSAVHFKAA